VGPCGQTDRLAILGVACLIAQFTSIPVWDYLVPGLCAGCTLTIVLRIYRSIKEIHQLDAVDAETS
jgi:hypothetical protein